MSAKLFGFVMTPCLSLLCEIVLTVGNQSLDKLIFHPLAIDAYIFTTDTQQYPPSYEINIFFRKYVKIAAKCVCNFFHLIEKGIQFFWDRILKIVFD